MSPRVLRCNTPGCTSTPGNVTAVLARAQFEYRQRHDPKYIYRLACDTCKKTSRYTYEQILGLIPPEDRPKPLPHDYFWSYILFEVPAWKGKDQRAYLGDRVLVQRLHTEPNGSWYGVLKSTSAYAPLLKAERYVRGGPRGNYELCLFVMDGGTAKPLPRPDQIPKAASFGMFVAPRDDENALTCANIMCSNPSCGYIYSTMTFTRFLDMISREQLSEESYDEQTYLPTIALACPTCGTMRIIDEESFEGLFKERE